MVGSRACENDGGVIYWHLLIRTKSNWGLVVPVVTRVSPGENERERAEYKECRLVRDPNDR